MPCIGTEDAGAEIEGIAADAVLWRMGTVGFVFVGAILGAAGG
jgi:hypothetical protein